MHEFGIIADCLLLTAHCFHFLPSALGTFHCLLLTADCPLPTADCLLLTLTLQTFTSMMSFQLVVGFGERFAWFGFQLLVFSEARCRALRP